ncbi:VolA/Pla-1 family phospholipase [Marinagarivorans algicola]|uniref:VolA/Pla-1 family phospholipase n=1 Tax=Marinagarivorans algicola TaxID=1513270 RepID=UPI0009E8DE04|nr:VolA/Pla-1 family phospholipase [Marinagarivorans algicola]
MKNIILSMSIASIIGLTACGSGSGGGQERTADDNIVFEPTSRIVFDPSNGALSIPNDLLFQGTTDGTLNLPVASIDGSDPQVALNALDGWSTVNPFSLKIDFPDGRSLEASSVSGGVKIFEATMGGSADDEECKTVARGLACKIVAELTPGVDFIAQKADDGIAVVPLKPLKPATTYLLALTNTLKDNTGDSVGASSTYEIMRLDVNTRPLAGADAIALQTMINSFEKAVVTKGVEADSLIYTMAMTTQSTTQVLNTVKGLMAAQLAQGGSPPAIKIEPSTVTVNDVFVSQGRVLPEPLQALYSTANYHTGDITLPYYSAIPSVANPLAPINSWWQARCDSGAILAGLAAQDATTIPEGPLDDNDAFCIAAGLRDLSSAVAVDTERHLTKFNPIPMPQGDSDNPNIAHPGDINVQMTTPKVSAETDAVRNSYGLPPLVEPANGWPVVILQHGITSKKEDMLVMSGILSTFGFATVAIDHPLHGSRGFDLDPSKPGDEINASTVSATHYMNLGSLLTTRDNLRQSTSDILGLRLGLNAVEGAKVDTSEVHYLGHSLGGITGINFVAVANAPVNPAIDDMFKVTANSLAMPGIMVAWFLLESGGFGDIIKSNLAFAQSEDFQKFVASQYTDPTEAELKSAYQAFYDSLNAEQQAGFNGIFAQFIYAAQTVVDSGDPINYAAQMASTKTPTHLIEVVGDDANNLSDQVVPNTLTVSPIGGTEGAIALLGLPSVSTTTEGSGVVRFLNGHHSSILSPTTRAESPDPALSSDATQEMQSQVAAFFASKGQKITVTNEAVVK